MGAIMCLEHIRVRKKWLQVRELSQISSMPKTHLDPHTLSLLSIHVTFATPPYIMSLFLFQEDLVQLYLKFIKSQMKKKGMSSKLLNFCYAIIPFAFLLLPQPTRFFKKYNCEQTNVRKIGFEIMIYKRRYTYSFFYSNPFKNMKINMTAKFVLESQSVLRIISPPPPLPSAPLNFER